jgi:hypothetical protein
VNHFGAKHVEFYSVKDKFRNSTLHIEFIEKQRPIVKNIIEQQRIDTLSLLMESQDSFKYLLLTEDDFPICNDKFVTILSSICHIEKIDNEFCGFFAGMGGAGYLFNVKKVLEMMKILLKLSVNMNDPHDITMQLCLDGTSCKHCDGHFYISPHLYFKHIGHESSTYFRKQKKKWQCGWRNVYTTSRKAQIVSDKIKMKNFKQYWNQK